VIYRLPIAPTHISPYNSRVLKQTAGLLGGISLINGSLGMVQTTAIATEPEPVAVTATDTPSSEPETMPAPTPSALSKPALDSPGPTFSSSARASTTPMGFSESSRQPTSSPTAAAAVVTAADPTSSPVESTQVAADSLSSMEEMTESETAGPTSTDTMMSDLESEPSGQVASALVHPSDTSGWPRQLRSPTTHPRKDPAMAHKVPDQLPNSPRLLQHTLGIVGGLSLLSSGAAVANTTPSTPVASPQSATELLVPAAAPEATDSAGPSSQERIPASIPAEADAPPGYSDVFIDSTTDYNLGATESPDNPTLIFSERSSGCQVTINQGQPVGNQCGTQGSASSAAVPSSQGRDGIRLGPVNINRQGVSVGNTTVISREAINRRIQPLNLLRQGQQPFVFPLSIPAPITSLFGWRVHPIFGDQRFHSGTDLAAPTGTPVLATQAGRVAVADAIGGYGLTVILRHGEGDLESRYAHLSRILVQPGEWIEQGDVVGLVGSTGNSTGPHLHFEIRQLTAQGWAVVDPEQILQQSVAQLVELLDNPLQALNRSGDDAGSEVPVSGPLPHRPAQPNAS